MRLRPAAALALAAVLGLPAAALAHGESTPEIRTTVDRVEPGLPGVRVRILGGGQTRLLVTNDGTEPLEVLGRDGRPFLRLGPGGAEANVNSLEWYRSGNAEGVAEPPPAARIGAGPRWVRVGRRPTWAWFDHRLHPAVRQPPSQGEAARLDDFAVPVRQGPRTARIEGHVDFRPLSGVVTPKLDTPSQVAPGVTVSLLPGQVPGLFLMNASGRAVTVRGPEDEPFARVGRRGVEVNVRSPAWAEDRAARGEQAPVRTDAAAPPRWRRVADVPRFSWIEGRARYVPGRPPDAVADSGRRTTLVSWSVPVDAGGRRAAVAGTTDWVPSGDPHAASGERRDGGLPAAVLLVGPVLIVLGLSLRAGLAWRRGHVRRESAAQWARR